MAFFIQNAIFAAFLLRILHFFVKMAANSSKIIKFAHENLTFYQQFDLRNIKMERTDINRLKVVLVEKKRTNKWLAEQLGRDPATVS